jgi:ribosomal protein S18 acetylase RimI-like enzyme
MVEVSEDRRRQGVATRLVRELEREFPGDEIDWGMMTEEGAALREAVED